MQTAGTRPKVVVTAESVPRVRAGIRRRRRRRYVVTAGVAAFVALAGLGAVNILGNRAPAPVEPAQGAIAWTDTPAALPNLTRRSPRPGVRACGDSDLSGKPWVETDTPAANGTTRYTVFIANGSDTRCTLAGAPQLTAAARDGQLAPLAASVQEPQYAGTQTPATIDPGEPVRADITITSCSGAPPPDNPPVAITVGQRSVTVPGLTSGCAFAVSPWYVQAPLINAPLTVTMSVPGTVRSGSTLTYQVTITNAADQSFTLSPCPVYQQGIGGTTGSYRLNCSTAAIPKHHSLTYEMHLDVPATAAPGPSKVTWMAVLADGTVAIANLATDGSTIQVLK